MLRVDVPSRLTLCLVQISAVALVRRALPFDTVGIVRAHCARRLTGSVRPRGGGASRFTSLGRVTRATAFRRVVFLFFASTLRAFALFNNHELAISARTVATVIVIVFELHTTTFSLR